MILLLFALPYTTLADDGAYYTGEPRLSVLQRKKPATPTSVAISVHNFVLSASYVFDNADSKPEPLKVRLDIPAYFNGGAGNWYPDRSFPELSMSINGSPVTYVRNSTAIFGGQDYRLWTCLIQENFCQDTSCLN